jgi:hypothetical protein
MYPRKVGVKHIVDIGMKNSGLIWLSVLAEKALTR